LELELSISGCNQLSSLRLERSIVASLELELGLEQSIAVYRMIVDHIDRLMALELVQQLERSIAVDCKRHLESKRIYREQQFFEMDSHK